MELMCVLSPFFVATLTVAPEIKICKCSLPSVSKRKHWQESYKLHSKILVMSIQLMFYFCNCSK